MPSAALAQAVRLNESELGMPDHPRSDHTQLARVLISTWALHTGRVLPGDVPPDELPAEDLIEFWADPLLDDAYPEGRGRGAARQTGPGAPGDNTRDEGSSV